MAPSAGAAMEVGKKMMEKMGWKKGQGLGKDKQGMTTPLLLRKNQGSSTQGRIEQSAPTVYSAKAKKVKTEQGSSEVKMEQPDAPAVGALAGGAEPVVPAKEEVQVVSQTASSDQAAAVVEATAASGTQQDAQAAKSEDQGNEESARKKRRTKWEDEESFQAQAVQASSLVPMGAVASPVGMFDIDPRDPVAASVRGMPGLGGMAAPVMPAELGAGMAAQAAEVAAAAIQAQLDALAGHSDGIGTPAPGTPAPSSTAATEKETYRLNGLPMTRRERIRQYIIDDWRWSKGTEALRYFEEVKLAKHILDLARKVLGEGSRYPARIADETDCITEVTAWGSLLVRPRGTGANLPLAKRMLFEILHPGSEDLRDDVMFMQDEMVEAELKDQSTIYRGMELENKERVEEGVLRSSHGQLRHVGIGAEVEATAELGTDVKSDVHEFPMVLADDAILVKRHLEDIRMASGAIPILIGMNLKLSGKEKQVRKAEQLVKTLIETGEWVALTEGFVLSEETKEQRRATEGPSEQILIKVAEGPATRKIELHLKAMERASAADQLKLTSKAVAGKRTLMVEGTRAAHERVKLMVKELVEKGESAMLSKAMGVARAAERPVVDLPAQSDFMSGVAGSGPAAQPPAGAAAAAAAAAAPAPSVPAVGKPVIAAGRAHLLAPLSQIAAANKMKAAAQPLVTPVAAHGGLPAQSLPQDLFAGLPPPEFPAPVGVVGAAAAAAAAPAAAAVAAPAVGAAVFPPLPPMMAEAMGAAPADAGVAAAALPVVPPAGAKDISQKEMAAAEKELLELAGVEGDTGEGITE